MQKILESLSKKTNSAVFITTLVITMAACSEQNGALSGTETDSSAGNGSSESNETAEPNTSTSTNSAPSVDTTIPVADAKQISPSASLQVTFDRSLLVSSVDHTQFTLHQNGNLVAAQVEFDGSIATLIPDEDLVASTHYTATVNSGIVDTDGNALVPHSWDFFTEGNGWSVEQQIGPSEDNPHYPQVSLNTAGNAIAVWYQDNGSKDSIFAKHFSPDSGWGTSERIDAELGDALNPQVGLDDNGNALAVWRHQQGYMHIRANNYSADTGWAADKLLELDSTTASPPQISVNADGYAIAVWSLDDPGTSTSDSIYANLYSPETGWGGAELLESSAENASDAQVGLDANGNALVVWIQDDGADDSIYANHYSAGSGWGTAELIETNSGRASRLHVDFAANGNAFAIWKEFNSGNSAYDILTSRYSIESGWETSESIRSGVEYSTSPQISVNSAGHAMASWHQLDGSTSSIYAMSYSAQTGWQSVELIESNSGNALSPTVVLDSLGNSLVLWRQDEGSVYSLYTNRYSATTNSWAQAELIESSAAYATYHQLSNNADGHAIAIWKQDDVIKVSHFDPRVVAP